MIAQRVTGEVMIEQIFHHDADGFWIQVLVERLHYCDLGPFETAAERQRVNNDLVQLMRQTGARDVPPAMQ